MGKLIVMMLTLAGGGVTFLWLRGGADLGKLAANARGASGGRTDPVIDRLDEFASADAAPA